MRQTCILYVWSAAQLDLWVYSNPQRRRYIWFGEYVHLLLICLGVLVRLPGSLTACQLSKSGINEVYSRSTPQTRTFKSFAMPLVGHMAHLTCPGVRRPDGVDQINLLVVPNDPFQVVQIPLGFPIEASRSRTQYARSWRDPPMRPTRYILVGFVVRTCPTTRRSPPFISRDARSRNDTGPDEPPRILFFTRRGTERRRARPLLQSHPGRRFDARQCSRRVR